MSKIIKAVFRNDIGFLKQNLNNSNVNDLDEDKRTPLIHACIDKQADIVKLLLEFGADVNIIDGANWMPLHYAVQENSKEIVKLLLEKDAVVDQLDENGNSPLWRAVFDFNGDFKVIKILVNAGANVNLVNMHGVSIKELAEGNNELLTILSK